MFSSPGLYCFTGCDTTSTVVQRGMVIPFKALEKYPEILSVFEQLGAEVICSQTTTDDLEKFVSCMYEKATYTNVNDRRYDLFALKYQGKSGQLQTAFDGLSGQFLRCMLTEPTIRRIYGDMMLSDSLMHQVQMDMGGNNNDNGIEYNRISGCIVPQELIDIIGTEPSKTANEGKDIENEVFWPTEKITPINLIRDPKQFNGIHFLLFMYLKIIN